MLDRAKVCKELTRISDDIFISYSDEYAHARRVWESIARDETFASRIASQAWTLPVPEWSGPLDASIVITPSPDAYQVIAVDGSQIYPDRHQGSSCYLINIGTISLHYQSVHSSTRLHSEPYVFAEYGGEQFQVSSTDMVNAMREAYEFESGYAQIMESCHHDDTKILLFDGSLIFWHLETKDPAFKHFFVSRYVSTLNALYEARILHAAYVSMPRHREVSNLIRIALCNFELEGCALQHTIAHVTDAIIMHFFLDPCMRSTTFAYTGKLRTLYPQEVQPYFFYLHTGYEIGRVEIPAWIARSAEHCDTIASVLCDQARKGNGYPIALAEAHEQAVVKGPDREFFYQVITKFGVQRKKRMEMSLKSLKKRSIGV